MGAKFSQDAYQMKMDQILEGLQGVITIHDDISVFGKGDEDHDANLSTDGMCQRNWIDFKQQEIFNWTRFSFLLWSYLWKGWNTDPKKIQGILEMPPPKDTTQLQSFLWMVNFMHNFISHLSEHTAMSEDY